MKSGSGNARSVDAAGGLRLLPLGILAVVLLIAASACRKDKKIDVSSRDFDLSKSPTMVTTDVATLISDSGIVQYKMVTPVWYVYDQTDTPYWKFPKGVYLRKYDRNFKVIATVAADSAKFFSDRKLWKLDGHVEITKDKKDMFATQQLYWDQRSQQLYSDSFIHIQTPTHVLEGYGFISNDRLTEYSVKKPTGIFPADASRLNRDNEPKAQTPNSSSSVSGVMMQPQQISSSAL